ncbi:MAG: hypothetical protein HY459_03560 [Parcubacteria group bacterium]|nr:hypothetical protein [Parcubacteria group bacterium]MBI4457417.1 hypothetical protein [Candidatus Uhrbacteria bacterium]
MNKPSKFEILLAVIMLLLLPPVTFLMVQHFKGPQVMDTAAANADEAKTLAAQQDRRVTEVSQRLDQVILQVKSAQSTAENALNAFRDQVRAAANNPQPQKEAAHADQPPPPADEPAAAAPAADDPSGPCGLEDFDEAALHETPARLHRLRPCGQPAADK